MREYRVGDVVQVTKSGKHNGKIGVIVSKGICNSATNNKHYQVCVSFDLNEVPLDKTFDFYNSRNGVNSSWYNASNVEPASYEDSFEFIREQVISLSSNIGKTIQGKNIFINEVDKETLVNTMQYAIQFKKEDPLCKENKELKQRIQELEKELDSAYFDVAERDRRINDLEQERNKILFLLNYGNCNAQHTIDELREYFASNIEEPSMNYIIKEINNLKKELVNINEKLEQVHRLSII